MPDQAQPFEREVANLSVQIEQLRRAEPPPRPRPPVPPLQTIRPLVEIIVFLAAGLLVHEINGVLAEPDERVVVSREGNDYHVWQSTDAFESATGKSWIEPRQDSFQQRAVFHPQRYTRSAAVGGVALTVLVLALIVLRRAQQHRG